MRTIGVNPSAHSIWPLVLWFGYFVATPFYVLGSGLPQPADWILAVIFMYIFLENLRYNRNRHTQFMGSLFNFTLYIVVVNFIWFFLIDQSQERRFPTIVFALFYIFNYLAVRSSLVLSKVFGNKVLLYTVYGIAFSLIVQFGISLTVGRTESRSGLFFNNPNQLGYYALISGSLLTYAVRFVKINYIVLILSYFAFFYLTLISASKAALGGSILLIALALIGQRAFRPTQLLITLLAVAGSYYFVSSTEIGTRLFGYSVNRFNEIGQGGDDNYEGRGYDRIINNPEYIILGAGEGGFYRFDTRLTEGEIHSSIGTILFCYGIPGTILFGIFLYNVFRKSSFLDMLFVLPVMAYSVSHNGLRDTFFWIFLSTVYIINSVIRGASQT